MDFVSNPFFCHRMVIASETTNITITIAAEALNEESEVTSGKRDQALFRLRRGFVVVDVFIEEVKTQALRDQGNQWHSL